MICRQAGPESSPVMYARIDGRLLRGRGQAHLSGADPAPRHLARFASQGEIGTWRVIEGSIRWCRMAGDGPEHGWVYGVRLTSLQKIESSSSAAHAAALADSGLRRQ